MSYSRIAKGALRIPKRIDRGPTDLLKALNSTVKFDRTLPSYNLIDDPYLLTQKCGEARFRLAAKLSGVKAAKFILNKYPELFYRDDAEPKVEAFLPKEEFRSDMEFSEDDIKWCIDNLDPVNAIIAYQSLEEKNVKLNDETLLQLFELLCYANEEEIPDAVDRSLKYLFPGRELVLQNWIKDGIASKIFNKIKDDIDPPRVYSTMIAGLSKYNEYSTALKVFEEFQTNHPNKSLYIQAYEGLISSIPKSFESPSVAHQGLKAIIGHMQSNLVMPSLELLNAILRCYSTYKLSAQSIKEPLKIINDMKSLGIEPSLASLAAIIRVFCKFDSQTFASEIENILNHIKSKPSLLRPKHTDDETALLDMMDSFTWLSKNPRYAKFILRLSDAQPNLFTSDESKMKYFNKYFELALEHEPVDRMFQFYDRYVPVHFQPFSRNYKTLTKILELSKAPPHVIKKVGQHLILFGVAEQIEDDKIYREDPEYVKGFEELLERKAKRKS